MVVTGALLVAALCWWFWPRVDQRFVGNWIRAVPEANGLGESYFEFAPDGSGSCGVGDTKVTDFSWKVSGPYLTLHYGSKPGLNGLHQRLRSVIFSDDHVDSGSQRLYVSTIRQDRIVWQPLSDDQSTPVPGDDVFDMKRVRP